MRQASAANIDAGLALGVAGVLAGLDATDDEAEAVWARLQPLPLPSEAPAALRQVREVLRAVRGGR